jgi:hypothetical protein
MLDFILNSLKNNPIAVISALVSITAFVFSYISWRKTRTATLYSDIDGRYMDLLKLGINNPEFVDPANTKDYKNKFKKPDDLLKYGRYAYAAWNIVETIVDRRTNDDLRGTWDPVIREENWLHRRWLNDKDNQHKFKKAFWNFMIGNEDFPCPDCRDKSLCARCNQLRSMVQSDKEIPIDTSL